MQSVMLAERGNETLMDRPGSARIDAPTATTGARSMHYFCPSPRREGGDDQAAVYVVRHMIGSPTVRRQSGTCHPPCLVFTILRTSTHTRTDRDVSISRPRSGRQLAALRRTAPCEEYGDFAGSVFGALRRRLFCHGDSVNP